MPENIRRKMWFSTHLFTYSFTYTCEDLNSDRAQIHYSSFSEFRTLSLSQNQKESEKLGFNRRNGNGWTNQIESPSLHKGSALRFPLSSSIRARSHRLAGAFFISKPKRSRFANLLWFWFGCALVWFPRKSEESCEIWLGKLIKFWFFEDRIWLWAELIILLLFREFVMWFWFGPCLDVEKF